MKFAFLLLLTLLLSACSGQKPGSRGLEVSFSSIVGDDILGGAVVRIENPASGTFEEIELLSHPFVVVIPDGKWNIYFTGFVGPGAWQGSTHCGSVLNLNLAPETSAINISVSTSNCSNAPYSVVIGNKQPVWDASLWDQTKWAP